MSKPAKSRILQLAHDVNVFWFFSSEKNKSSVSFSGRLRMPTFKLPLSGDVVQSINPWTNWFSPSGGQYGLININLGQSSKPEVEAEVLSDIGTYGKQLGRIGDVLCILLKHLPNDEVLSAEENGAIDALKEMLTKIADTKEKYGLPAIRP
jgi:hypothetical protein